MLERPFCFPFSVRFHGRPNRSVPHGAPASTPAPKSRPAAGGDHCVRVQHGGRRLRGLLRALRREVPRADRGRRRRAEADAQGQLEDGHGE